MTLDWGRFTTKAFGISPATSSGIPMTATSSTSSYLRSKASSSAGGTYFYKTGYKKNYISQLVSKISLCLLVAKFGAGTKGEYDDHKE